MEFSRFLVCLLLLILMDSSIDARRSVSVRGSKVKGNTRYTTKGTSKPRQPQTTQASQTKQGQEYRDWAAKLTGAGNEQRPIVTGNTGQHGKQGSNPGQIGWNVPAKQPAGGIGTKPSAPDLATKTSATNVQSGYSPSGGYNNRQPVQNSPYGQSTGNQYNPSSGQGGYNPPVGGGHHPYGAPPPYSPTHGGAPPPYSAHGQSYNPSYSQSHSPPAYGQSYNPSYSQSHSPPAYGQPYNPYNPSHGHSYSSNPGSGYNPPVGHVPQTILIQQGGGASGRPGIGQLAKEAFVFAGVSAGVNAAVNRIIPGGIYGNSHSGSSSSSGNSNPAVPAVAGPVSHTQITYNNYYNNGTNPATDDNGSSAAPVNPGSVAVPAVNPIETPAAGGATDTNASSPAPSSPNNGNPTESQEAQKNPSPLGFIVTDADLKKISEDLSSKETNNAFKHITMNLQGKKMDDTVTDDAPESLLTVKDEAYDIPTIKAVVALHDNYELDVKTKEEVTSEERREEDELLDKLLETDVLKRAMKFLSDKGYVPNDEYEYKDALKRIWFSQFKRIDGDASSSGFETVFLAEQFEKEIIGLHNWIYFAKQESAKKINYLGYIKDKSLGSSGAIVKLRSTLNDIVQPVTTIFVGTSPELEMALYTVCFFTRPNNPCPVSIAGTEFVVIANRVNYFGKDIIVSAYPEI